MSNDFQPGFAFQIIKLQLAQKQCFCHMVQMPKSFSRATENSYISVVSQIVTHKLLNISLTSTGLWYHCCCAPWFSTSTWDAYLNLKILVQLSCAIQDQALDLDGKFFHWKRTAMTLEIRCFISWCEVIHITRHLMLSNKWSEALKFNSHARGCNWSPVARACCAQRAWSRKDCSMWRRERLC